MTRQARVESNAGIYHVMLRGINRQNIFEEREDYERFKECLSGVKKKCGIKLFGYCLLSNHIHILTGTDREPIGTSLKRICVSYVFWYNRKYNRQGPLFQDRFKSEPVEDDIYLLSALRYIHQNPVKAGICSRLRDYQWSSYIDYMDGGDGFTDTGDVLNMFSLKNSDQIRLFEKFMNEENDAVFADIGERVYTSDEVIREKIIKVCGARSVGEFQLLSHDERLKAVRALRDEGISIRQIVRMTGEPFGIVRKSN